MHDTSLRDSIESFSSNFSQKLSLALIRCRWWADVVLTIKKDWALKVEKAKRSLNSRSFYCEYCLPGFNTLKYGFMALIVCLRTQKPDCYTDSNIQMMPDHRCLLYIWPPVWRLWHVLGYAHLTTLYINCVTSWHCRKQKSYLDLNFRSSSKLNKLKT